MKKKDIFDTLKYLGSFLSGSIILSLFSIFQKAVLGVSPFPFQAKGFIVPFFFGGFAGFFIAIFYFRLKKSQAQLEDYLDNMDDLVQIVSADKRFLYVNKAWRDTLQYTPEEVKKLKLSDILPPEKKTECDLIFQRVFAGEHIGEFETVFIAKDGKKVYLRGSSNGSKKGEVMPKTRGIFRNITDSIEAEEFQRLSAQIFENTQEGLLITTPKRIISWVNPAFSKISGYSKDEVFGKDAKALFLVENDAQNIYSEIVIALESGKNWQGEIWAKRKDGSIYPIEASISTVLSKLGKTSNYICLFSDISQRKKDELHLKQMAWFDQLTELPNRLHFNKIVTHTIEESASEQERFSVFFLDLDGFKKVNDQYGHAKGDELLLLVARRLTSSLRQVDAVARLGGDEFGVLLRKSKSREDVCKIAQNLSNKLSAPYLIDQMEIYISTSIGISFYPDYTTLEDLINAADRAMYEAKADPDDNIYFAIAD